MRGELDEPTLHEIGAKLPDIRPLFKIRTWTPPVTSAACMLTGDVGSALPLAGVCLNDTLSGIAEARCALHEALACLTWYREKSPRKPNEPAAVFTARFYATAAASCLYASGERLADALAAMLGIDSSKLPASAVSRQRKVAQYLEAQMPGDPMTTAVESLGASPDWKKSRDLRDRWVHEQPPIIAGSGIQWRRRSLWIRSDVQDGEAFDLIAFSGGDEPDYSVDEMVSVVDGALKAFVCLFEFVAESYEQKVWPCSTQDETGVITP